MDEQPPLILIVDDEADLLASYKTKFERSGFRVLTATNGEEGIAAAAASQPNLILMDVKMPVMDGVEAQQKLKENPATQAIKLVFLTAFSDPSMSETDVGLAHEIGATDFIRKGISLDELVAKVRAYLAQ